MKYVECPVEEATHVKTDGLHLLEIGHYSNEHVVLKHLGAPGHAVSTLEAVGCTFIREYIPAPFDQILEVDETSRLGLSAYSGHKVRVRVEVVNP